VAGEIGQGGATADNESMTDTAEQQCPRCAELRGRSVKMNTVKIGRTPIATAYECPSCDYVIPLRPFLPQESK
jgi:hypothetical protein